MQFNTYLYILLFLPITVIGWFLLNKLSHKVALVFLIAASLFFYAYAGLEGFVWLLISMVVNYGFVLLLERFRNKLLLVLGVAFNIALLFYFKYTNFAIATVNQVAGTDYAALELVLPVGISFFTFQQISYLVDSYRGGKTSLLDYVLYVTFFPKILMGPIVKRDELLPQLHDEVKCKPNAENITRGLRMFIFGLVKKVLLADTFAKAVSWGMGLGSIYEGTSMDWLLVMFAYTFQIYFDFSGYSDMATGTALMLNIELPMNFDSPYKAYSIRDFWKRWHISLTKFLTEYIYIPLGGSKKGVGRTYLNTMIVFLISGIWHGANWTFILWGFLHGAFSVFDRLTEKWRKNVHPALQWLLTFLVVSVLWLLFRADSIGQWWDILCHILTFQNTQISESLISVFTIPYQSIISTCMRLYCLSGRIRCFWMLVFYAGAFFLCLAFENVYRRKYKNNVFTALVAAVLLTVTLTCLSSESVFVYFNF